MQLPFTTQDPDTSMILVPTQGATQDNRATTIRSQNMQWVIAAIGRLFDHIFIYGNTYVVTHIALDPSLGPLCYFQQTHVVEIEIFNYKHIPRAF